MLWKSVEIDGTLMRPVLRMSKECVTSVNVAFFLTPKSDVVWLSSSALVREALDCMKRHRYTALPLLDSGERYVGTLTEGDLLFELYGAGRAVALETLRLTDVRRRVVNLPVHIDANVEELLFRAIDQNFVPVIDDRGIFIGIVRRRPIIEYCAKLMRTPPPPPDGR
jgi:CBS-domain-containing membrane protein